MKHQATKSPSDQLLATEWNAEHLLTQGLDASKPNSGLVARQLYWATDTKILYKATSATTWEELLRGETVSRVSKLSDLKVKPSDTVKNSNNTAQFTNSTTYVKLKETKINERIEGCRVWFTISTPNATYWAYGRIYKNGSPIGTERSTNSVSGQEFSEDFASIDLQPDDLLQIYCHCDPGGQVAINNFRIGYEIDPTSVTKSTTNQDP